MRLKGSTSLFLISSLHNFYGQSLEIKPKKFIDGQICHNFPNKLTKYIKKVVFEIYSNNLSSCDGNPVCNTQNINLMYQKVLNKIISTKSAPCEYIYQAKLKRQAAKNSRLQPKINFNCNEYDCDLAIDFRNIWSYGCYCNFEKEYLVGRGKAVNIFDEACQKMQSCLRCVEMDYGKTCDVRNINVNKETTKCSKMAHSCQEMLISDIIDITFDKQLNITFDRNYRQMLNPFAKFNNGILFDKSIYCYANDEYLDNGVECCGEYPTRYIYNSLVKSCCVSRNWTGSYNPFDTVCCEDGLHKIGDGACL